MMYVIVAYGGYILVLRLAFIKIIVWAVGRLEIEIEIKITHLLHIYYFVYKQINRTKCHISPRGENACVTETDGGRARKQSFAECRKLEM